MTRSEKPNDILTRLHNATPYGLEDPRVLSDAITEIKQLRTELAKLEAFPKRNRIGGPQ